MKSAVMYLAIMFMMLLQEARAQEGQGKVKELLLKMQRAYQEASYLDFRITYYYANQSLPEKPLDSLLGKVQMDKGRCRLVIDNTEMLVTNNYTIQVMRQDKAIYLTKAKHSGLIDPVGLLDSVLAHMNGVRTESRHKDGLETVVIHFPAGQQYTAITMTIDEKAGFLTRVTYDLHASTLVSQDMIDRPDHPGLYQAEGQVDVVFSGYRTGSFGENMFDENRFIHKVADKFEPSERFKDYHVFFTPTNL
jgi:hypothetical protein